MPSRSFGGPTGRMHVLNGRGSHSFGSGSGAAVRMPAASIEQVLEQLDGIVRTAHATGSRLGYFAALRRFGASSSVASGCQTDARSGPLCNVCRSGALSGAKKYSEGCGPTLQGAVSVKTRLQWSMHRSGRRIDGR
jgi:hypothetical protein